MSITVPIRRVAAPRPTASGRVGAARHREDGNLAEVEQGEVADDRPRHRGAPRPDLRIVPKPRAAVNAALVLGFVVVVLMLGTVVLHTRLAERQVQIDQLEQDVEASRSRFDVLRQQRAELRSPTRLALEAQHLGMIPAPRTEFLAVDPHTIAEVLAAAGIVDETTGSITTTDPLDQIRRVKASEGSGG
jgi:cell division protein FtsL